MFGLTKPSMRPSIPEYRHSELASAQVMLEYGFDHGPRFDYLENLVLSLGLPRCTKVLDVGPGFFTLRLSEHFDSVSSLGLASARHLVCRMPESIPHYEFDLNESRHPDRWIQLPKFDLIVFAEVVEHLHTAPQQVLRFLASSLVDGGRIILQTPNAVSLDKRAKMLIGLHPYDLILEDWTNPNHFREYTRDELVRLGREAGLIAERHEFRSYFKSPRLGMKMIDILVAPFPSLKRGQTIILRR